MKIGKENENLEFKRSVSESKEGIASISSMLNKHGKAQVNNLNSTEERVFAVINDNNKVTAKEMAELLDVSERTINRALKKLTELRYIYREGSDKTGSWKVNL